MDQERFTLAQTPKPAQQPKDELPTQMGIAARVLPVSLDRGDRLRSGVNPQILAFFRTFGRDYPDACQSIYREIDGEIVGGWIFTGFTGESIQIHFCGRPGWMSRRVYWTAFDYTFNQLGVKVVIAAIDIGNNRAKKIAHGTGFKEVGIIREIGLVLMKLSRGDCWILQRGANG